MPNPLTETDKSYLDKTFKYHAPKDDQPVRYTQARDMAYELAEFFLANSNPSRERSLALTNLEQAIMWFNAGVARNE